MVEGFCERDALGRTAVVHRTLADHLSPSYCRHMKIGPDIGAETVRGMSPSNFDHVANVGQFWIQKGVELFRAALVLQRQVITDFPDLELGPVKLWPASVSEPAVMLAAMAVECALKGVLAEKAGVAQNGKLALGKIEPHDLEALAKAVQINPVNPIEEDALREARGFIT